MAQADYELSVRVEVNTPDDNTAGGEDADWDPLVTTTATKHFYSRQGLERFDGLPGPGTMTKTKLFFKFTPPFPSVNVARPQDYRIVEAVSGLIWPVQHIRSYTRTMQMDCELIG